MGIESSKNLEWNLPHEDAEIYITGKIRAAVPCAAMDGYVKS